jgi:hypothetical protein
MSIWVPVVLSVLPTSIGNGSFWLFVAVLSAVSLLGLSAARLDVDERTGATQFVGALYAAARRQGAPREWQSDHVLATPARPSLATALQRTFRSP